MAKAGKLSKLFELSGANRGDSDPFETGIRITRSPSVGFAFGNTHILPSGFTLLCYGPNKGGKSLLAYDTVAALHEDDPTAFAIKWDTEFREKLQLTPKRAKMYGIDRSRYCCWSTNKADEIFDRFETDVVAAIQKGDNVRLAIIDSTSSIIGRRAAETESVNDYTIGDHAQTLQIGLQRILPVIRQHNIALILITHVRAEMDQTQVKRGKTIKAQAGWAVKHFAEYFALVERDETKAGRTDEHGNEMVNDSVSDVRQTVGEQTGHKIRFTITASSAGPAGRMGAFTYDYSKGISNVHEEIFLLAKARNVITTKGSHYYLGSSDGGEKLGTSKDATLDRLEKDVVLQKTIMDELKRRDLSGEWSADEDLDDSVLGPDAVVDQAVPGA